MLERSLFLIPGVTYLGGGKRGNLWLYPLLIVTSLRYLSACSDGNSLSFPFSPVFVRYNCQPARGVSLFDRSNSTFRLCSRHEIACHFTNSSIPAWIGFFGIFRLTFITFGVDTVHCS